MVDFMMISKRRTKEGVLEVYPKFIIKKSEDLMIRGSDFYAIWIEETGFWSLDEEDLIHLIDSELKHYIQGLPETDSKVKARYMWDAESGMIDVWHKYCQRQMRDHYHALDEKLIFSNTETTKKDYASKRLPYPLEKGSIDSYDELISVLYEDKERQKIEWSIGAVISGDSKTIQKFLVFYGESGSGKSTILNIMQQLFTGYYSTFDSRALGSSTNAFALEAFRSNPLVAIQHDGDLSRIEDNTRLNSLVSHEEITVNEKYKTSYTSKFNSFLFMGTNKPVKITDAKSGLIRRLIDVSPSGNKIIFKKYNDLVSKIRFELGAIAYHCLGVYESNKELYDEYIPTAMLSASNDFYNFILDSYSIFSAENSTTLTSSWEMYNAYCQEARVSYPLTKRVFKEELKNYFKNFEERHTTKDGVRFRSYYSEFRKEKFDEDIKTVSEEKQKVAEELYLETWLEFKEQPSIFNELAKDYPAQQANDYDVPSKKWDDVTTTLKDIDTSKTHYVQLPINHIVIDFDLKEDDLKSLEKNIVEASKWPKTYAELSKSGKGIHLHYIYTGKSPENLNRLYSDNIEVKVFTGKSSLQRKLTKCNDLEVDTLSSGLKKKKKKKKVINKTEIKSEQKLRELVIKNMKKEIHPNTKPSIDFIDKILDDAYNGTLSYDLSDLKPRLLTFAMRSTNNTTYCIKKVNNMKLTSKNEPVDVIVVDSDGQAPIVIFDVEVFPNLFLVNYKELGEGNKMYRLINPGPKEMETLLNYRLVGFNNRKYDNHILYSCLLGYTNSEIYNVSKRIINGDHSAFFGAAYNLSYTDIYDFSSNKQSLKKWEIEMGFSHKELGLPWDKPVPEEKWDMVSEYCDNDVLATEALFHHLEADWTARKILADLAEESVNATTNNLTAKIIFGDDVKKKDSFGNFLVAEEFEYRNMGDISKIHRYLGDPKDDFAFDVQDRPIFPGYKYEYGVSTYRDEIVGEGGYVFAIPGMYGNVALLDIASMHPTSAIEEYLFGEYTHNFEELVQARIFIKHKEYEAAKGLFNGKLRPYLDDAAMAKALSNALKIPINSVYGLTSAKFSNAFKDIRNVDNIVAKRGALFMINLKHAVQAKGYVVSHIKTDSIKIPDADMEIIEFIMEFGKEYGYTFEHEATYNKMLLANKADYIARYADVETCKSLYGYIPGDNVHKENEWVAVGAMFQVPYVFKTLFSKEDIVFGDLCQSMNTKTAFYLDMNEFMEGEDPHCYIFVGKAGAFTPVKPNTGGGLLVRKQNPEVWEKAKDSEKGVYIDKDTGERMKFAMASGATGYRWRESEQVQLLKIEDDIDKTYYESKVEEVKNTIAQLTNFDWFISDQKYVELPFDM